MAVDDWGINDPNNEWGFEVPDPKCGPRKYNQDLLIEQGLDDDACPDYGFLVQTREVHRQGQRMTIFYYSTGWVETWYWKHCPPYSYRTGYWVNNEWYPPDWGNESNDEWWDKQQPNYRSEKDDTEEFNWDD